MKYTVKLVATLLNVWLVVVSVIGLPFTAFTLALLVDLIRPLTAHAATTYYIDDAGSDAANGLTTSTPWRTWAFAFANSACGDTLIVMDGTYTVATHGRPTLTKACTVGNPYTIRSQNQRVALLSGDGAAYTIRVLDSAYVVLDGLRVKSVLNTTGCPAGPTAVFILQSNHITLKNGLIYTNNYYCNVALLAIHNNLGNLGSNGNKRGDNLVEDTELYDFHRHAASTYYSTHNVLRRVYCHSRNRADVPGGWASPAAPNTGDGCVAIYPGSDTILENVIAENVLELVEINATAGTGLGRRNQVLGSVVYGNSTYPSRRGIVMDSRGNDTNGQVQDTTIRDFVSVHIGNTYTSTNLSSLAALNTQIVNATIIDHGNRVFGAYQQGNTGGGIQSYFCTNCLAISGGTEGFYVDTVNTDTWTITNSNAYQNGTNYSPATHANYEPSDTPSAVDPQLGDCYLWQPDGSAAKTNNWGANILYRWVDGVLTTTPLWDPTTGEFPHGAVIAGVNDVVGASLFDVHKRLNVPYPGDTHTCNFPATYAGGGGPSNPAGQVTSQGTTNPSHVRTVTAAKEALTLGIALTDTGGNVGTVSADPTSSCGSESFTQVATAVTSPAYRRVYLYRRLNPTAGASCTISVTTTGTITASVLISNEYDDVAAFGTAVTAAGLSATPSVTTTVAADAGNFIVDMLAAKCGPSGGACGITLTADANQTLTGDQGHLTLGDIRGATSQQASTSGGLMSYTMGGLNYWAIIAVPMCAVSCDAGTNVLDVTKYGFFSGFGTEAGSTALAATSTAVNIAPTGMVRIRAEISASVATTPPFGFSLYCRKNADSYTQALDTFGSNVFRLYGAGVDADIPSSFTSTSARLTAQDANTVVGAFLRDQASAFIVPQMASGKRIEMEWLVVLNATAGDTIDCEPRFDSGAVLKTPLTVTPRINVVPPSASGFSSLPEQPWGLTATPNPTWGPRPSRGTLVHATGNMW